jgi:hypothetical protein
VNYVELKHSIFHEIDPKEFTVKENAENAEKVFVDKKWKQIEKSFIALLGSYTDINFYDSSFISEDE